MFTSLFLDRRQSEASDDFTFSCESWSASETVAESRKCHMPCPVTGCAGRCHQVYGHGGSHHCSNGHPDW